MQCVDVNIFVVIIILYILFKMLNTHFMGLFDYSNN